MKAGSTLSSQGAQKEMAPASAEKARMTIRNF
jgi:hypothetical protein